MYNNLEAYRKPKLTEPGVKYFLSETLKQCHIVKEKYHNIILNIILCIMFLLVLGGFLLYKFKGKLTPEEIEQKEIEKKHYILSKIRNFQDAKLRAQETLITGLPQWTSELDAIK
jgi:hypothetical protein